MIGGTGEHAVGGAALADGVALLLLLAAARAAATTETGSSPRLAWSVDAVQRREPVAHEWQQ